MSPQGGGDVYISLLKIILLAMPQCSMAEGGGAALLVSSRSVSAEATCSTLEGTKQGLIPLKCFELQC